MSGESRVESPETRTKPPRRFVRPLLGVGARRAASERPRVSALRTTLLSKPVTSAKPAKKVVARRYHMHSGGVFYIVVTVLLGIGHFLQRQN